MVFSTDAQDLTIGIADADPDDGDVIESIGIFLKLLTLRFKRQLDQNFTGAIAEARNTTWSALGNSRLPFDVVLNEINVVRSSACSPFSQAFLDYRQGAQEKYPFIKTYFSFQEIHPGRTAYYITMDVTDNAQDALIIFPAQKCLYHLTAANSVLETYFSFVDKLSCDASPSLKAPPLFGEKQLTQAVEIGRGPILKFVWPGIPPHRIEQVAGETQDKVALMDGIGSNLTYSDMIDRIQAISKVLHNAHIGAGSPSIV
ncbi:MAG: hypothetical protein Q9181_003572 [Wetmoreana brouardii]